MPDAKDYFGDRRRQFGLIVKLSIGSGATALGSVMAVVELWTVFGMLTSNVKRFAGFDLAAGATITPTLDGQTEPSAIRGDRRCGDNRRFRSRFVTQTPLQTGHGLGNAGWVHGNR